MTTDIETIRGVLLTPRAMTRHDFDVADAALSRIEQALDAPKEHEPVEMWWKLRRERAVVFRCNGVEWSMNAEEYPTVTEGWKVWKNR